MITDPQTLKRRQTLSTVLKLLFTGFILTALWVSGSFLSSTEEPANSRESMRISLAEIAENEVLIVQWQQRPVLILKRSALMIERINAQDTSALVDANSLKSDQADWAKNKFRSLGPTWLIVFARGTDLGCPIEMVDSPETEINIQGWIGGFKDTCRGSYYDFSGRIYKGQEARKNLIVPHYKINANHLILEE
jgi:ubiquinol-cytochrome c reductase iron-sulfur subunit